MVEESTVELDLIGSGIDGNQGGEASKEDGDESHHESTYGGAE